MGYEQRDNQGSLFQNEEKQSANSPDLKGSIMVDGKLFWISGWNKARRDGQPWISLSVTAKKAAEHAGGSKNPPAPTARNPTPAKPADFDDDIPF